MAEANANIRVGVDTSDALVQLKALQRRIAELHSTMARGGAAAAAEAQNFQRNLVNAINNTGQFSASLTRISSTADSFTTALEKNKLSMGDYFRFAGASTKTFSKVFTTEFNTIEKVARERVKTLQTQYISLGRDASGALKGISVRPLKLDMKDLGTQVMMTAQKQQIFNKLINQGSTNLLNFGKNTQWAGRQLMVGFTIPLTILGTTASKVFMEIEEQLIRFKRVYGEFNTSAEEADKMAGKLRDLAAEFTKYGVAVKDTLAMAADAAAMGKMGNDLLAQVEQAAKLAVLGGVEQEKALETTIALTNTFGVATEDLTNKISFLNAVENQTVVSIEDLTTAIPKAGPVVRQLGGDVEDLAFFLTAMKEGGINASEGANALKSGLASLINPTQKANEMLAGFGINVRGIVESNAGNIKDTVIDFANALDTLDPLNRARAIEEMFGKFQFARLSTLFQNIVTEGTQASRVLELTQSSAEELAILSERELKRVEESTGYRFKQALEEVKNNLAPVGEEFLKAITPIVKIAGKVLEWFNNLGDGAKQFAVIATAAVGVIAPTFLMMFGLIANGLANFIKGISKVGGFLGFLSGQSRLVGGSTSYMTQEQLEAASIAASLDQTHQRLIQTFTSEAAAIQNLANAYLRAAPALRTAMPTTGGATGGGGKPPVSTNPFMPPKFADGILSVPGPKGAGDIIAAMLSPGEAVIPADMAKKYAPFIQGIIADNVPGFKTGYSKNIAGRVVEETHVAPALGKTDAVLSEVDKLVPNFSKLSSAVQDAFIVLGDLTATKTRELNQQAKGMGKPVGDPTADRAMTGKEFLSEWNVTKGTGFDRVAERAGLVTLEDHTPGTARGDDGVPEALSELDQEVGNRVAARIDAMPETEKAVEGWLDRLMEEVTQEVISEFAQEAGTAKAKVAQGLAGRAATPAGLRTARVQNLQNPDTGQPYGSADAYFQDQLARGNLETREGLVGLWGPGTNIKASRPKNGKQRTNSVSSSVLGTGVTGGTFEYPSGKGDTVGAVDEVKDAYLGGQKIAEAHNDGIESTVRDPKDISSEKAGRNSPHPDAFPDGVDDAKDYNRGQVSVLGPGSDSYRKPGSPLAPPPAPMAPEAQPKSFLQRTKDKVLLAVAKPLARAAGNDLVDETTGETLYDAAADEKSLQYKLDRDREAQEAEARLAASRDKATEATEELARTTDQAADSIKQNAEEMRTLPNGKQVSKSQYDSIMAKEKKRQDRRSSAGRLAGGMAVATMGLGALTQVNTELFGVNIGKAAQALLPFAGGLQIVGPMLRALPLPIAALAVAAALGVTAFVAYNNALKKGAREAYELQKALGGSREAIQGFAEFAGRVTDFEKFQKQQEGRFNPFAVASGKNTFGESFAESDIGQSLVGNIRTSLTKLGRDQTVTSIFLQLGQAVGEGALSIPEARSIATELGDQLGDIGLGMEVNANLMRLVGPGGEELLAGDKLTILAEVREERQAARGAIDYDPVSYGEAFASESEKRTQMENEAGGIFGMGALLNPDYWKSYYNQFFGVAQAQANMEQMGTILAQGVNDADFYASQMAAIEATYAEDLASAYARGDEYEIERLEEEKRKAREDLAAQRQVNQGQVLSALGEDQPKALIAMKQALKVDFGDDPEALAQYTDALTKLGALDVEDDKKLELQYMLTAGDMPLQTAMAIVDNFDEMPRVSEKIMEVQTKFGGDLGGSVSELYNQFKGIDEALAEDFVLQIDTTSLETAAQDIQAFAAINNVKALFPEGQEILLDLALKDPKVLDRIQERLKKLENMDNEQITVEWIGETYGADAMAAAALIWESIDPADRKDAAYSIVTSLDFKMGDGAQAVLDSLGGQNIADVEITDFNSILGMIGSRVAGIASGNRELNLGGDEGDGGGGGPDASWLDPIVRQLRDFKLLQQDITTGFDDSLAAITEFSKRGVSGFKGLSNQLRAIGVSEPMLEKILGMSPEEWNEQKDQLFNFDAAGNITGLTAAGQAIQDAINTANIASFVAEQDNITVSVGNQITALDKLTAAGASYEAAYRAVQNTALASAIATAKSSREIQAAAEAAMKAQEMMDKFEKINEEEQRRKRIADAIKEQNKEFNNQAKILNYINKNRSKLSEAQLESILSNKDLQALILEPNIAPGALQTALDNANKKEQLELQIKKLTISGQEEIFQTGLSNAMQAFNAQEEKIEFEFEAKMSNEQDIIAKAQEDIAKLEYELDDFEAGLTEIQNQEDEINKAYDKRFEALDKIADANEDITRQQQSQLDIADALSRGDIAAAARAAQEARSAAATAASEDERARLEKAQAAQVAGLRSKSGFNREELEQKVKDIQDQIFRIEEDRLEPAEEAMRLAELQKEKDIEALEVLGKTREQWEQIANRIDIAKIGNYKFVDSMREALNIVDELIEKLGEGPPISIPTPPPSGGGGGGGRGGGRGKSSTPAPAPVVNTLTAAQKAAQWSANTSSTIRNLPSENSAAPVRLTPVSRPGALTAKKGTPAPVKKLTARSPEVKQAIALSEKFAKMGRAKSSGGLMKYNMGGFVRKAMSAKPLQMARGGMVSNYLSTMANGGFFMGSDSIPALLTPGEFVVRRPVVQGLGPKNLEKLNRGEKIGGDMYNYNLNVNVKSDSDPNQIARTVMSSIRQVESKRIRGNRF